MMARRWRKGVRAGLLVALGSLALPGAARAQVAYSPDDYEPRLRPTLLGYDPFEELLPARFGLAFRAGAAAGNSALDFTDIGALIVLDRDDEITPWDVLDLAGSVRDAGAFSITARSHARAQIMMGFGGFSFGLHAGGRAYGEAELEDELVTLLTTGTARQNEFSLIGSGGWGLATAEAGAHVALRSSAGVRGPALVVGAGARVVRPVGFFEGAFGEGGRVVLSGDSIVARVSADAWVTEFDGAPEISDRITDGSVGGSGMAFDLMARLEWETLALEVEALDIGTLTVQQVEHQTLSVDYAVSSVDSIISMIDERHASEAGDTLAFVATGIGDRKVTLPRTLRARVAWEVNGWAYLDGAWSTRSGRFRRRSRTEAGLTLAPVSWFPLRGGVVLENGAVGYSGSVAFDTGPLVLHVQGSTLGGWMDRGRGGAATFRFVLRT